MESELDDIDKKVKIFMTSDKVARKDPFNFRIHNNCHYIHKCSINRLLKHIVQTEQEYGKVKDNLLVILNEDNEFVHDYKTEIENMKLKIEYIDVILAIFKINCKLYAFKQTSESTLSQEELEKCITDLSKNELIEAFDVDDTQLLLDKLAKIEDQI